MEIEDIKKGTRLYFPCPVCSLNLLQREKELEDKFLQRAYDHANIPVTPFPSEDPLTERLILFQLKGYLTGKYVILGEKHISPRDTTNPQHIHTVQYQIQEAWEKVETGDLWSDIFPFRYNINSKTFPESIKKGFYRVLTPDEFEEFLNANRPPIHPQGNINPEELKITTPNLERLLVQLQNAP